MTKLIALAVVAIAAAVGAAGVRASPGDTTHLVTSDTWHGITYVTGLESCDLLGGSVFTDVDLTDQINITYTLNGSFLVNGVASFHGVINTPSGQYRVAGQSVEQDAVLSQLGPFVGTDGHATISGPNGVVTGEATFQDLTSFGPPEFDILFSNVTACNLR
jgi:hypothetical protein